MNRPRAWIVLAVVTAGGVGFVAGYLSHPETRPVALSESVVLSGENFSCGPSSQLPYLEGVLQFNLTNSYQVNVVASVAYTGNWSGDTNQFVYNGSTKHVAVTWGRGMMQD